MTMIIFQNSQNILLPSFPLLKTSYILKPWKLLILTSVKKRAGKVEESESEDEENEKDQSGKVVGWEKEDIDGDEEGEQEDEEEEMWKNPYLIFLDKLDDSDEEEVSHPSFILLTWQMV